MHYAWKWMVRNYQVVIANWVAMQTLRQGTYMAIFECMAEPTRSLDAVLLEQ